MKFIGFANKFYTLWDVTSKVVESKYSKHTIVTNTYIKNISINIDKVKELYPDVEIDESLRGHSCTFEYIKERKEINVDKFNFGKYEGQLISECNDESYLIWFFDNCDVERKKNVEERLVELGFVIKNDTIFTREEIEKQEQIERILSNKEELEVTFDRNLSVEFDSSNKCYGVYRNEDGILFKFNDVKLNYYNGFEYGLPLVNGKAKRIKNKTVKIKDYKYEITKYDTIVEVYDFVIVN